ncbi:MAG: hypothetical protein JWM93_3085 [Frankiales bacterium]|nr:hypothetical protein [Frankiales bacterium]
MARAGAVVLASALAVTLGAGPVSAETSTANGAVGTASAPVSDAAVITGFRMQSGVVTIAAVNFFPGTVSVGNVTTSSLTAETEVRVNGVYRGRAQLGPDGAGIPRGYGSGKVQLGPTYFSDGTSDPTLSNVFYARKQVTTLRKDKYALSVKRRNSKITFKARQIKVVNPSTGSYSRIKSVKLQQLKGGKWKTKKTIKLNSKGNGSYSTHLSKKYRYRLYTARTATQEQFFTRKTGKI